MDRNREARRAANMAAPPNGLSSSRRRHRSNSLRDSPDDDGGVEVQEAGRLRDRGVMKKDRGDRDRERERERERERSNRSKRRRENRMMMHHVTTGSTRDEGDDSSEESVNDEDEEEDDDGGGSLRMLPPPAANPSTPAATVTTNHHHHHHHNHPQQLPHRKSFPPSAGKIVKATAAPPPAWKAADEMIGVSVPRKARSASTKRSHEWISSGGAGVVGGGGGGAEQQIQRQSSTSPVRLASAAASPAPAAPPSPSSSSVSVRKKMKANGGGSKPRPPKSSSKSSSSNPEELEIEIAEVLYGLMTQSQPPSKKEDSSAKFDSNKSSSDTKSRVSSPISNSTIPPQNSTSLSAVAPKRKRPRQVTDNPFGVRSSPVSSSVKTETDHHHHSTHQSPKTDISSPHLENNSPASAPENGAAFGFSSLPTATPPSELQPPPPVAEEDGKCGGDVVLAKEEVKKESPPVRLNDGNGNDIEAMTVTAASTTATNLNTADSEIQSKTEEKFEIDLMAPPPQLRSTPERDGADIDFSDHKQMTSQETSKTAKDREDEKLVKSGKEEPMDLTEEQKKSKSGLIQEIEEVSKKLPVMEERSIDLHVDLEKTNKDASNNRSLHQVLKHQQSSTKETVMEKTGLPASLPLPMSVASWPSMGFVAPLQGVVSMDGSTMSPAPVQPIFTQPRPKRCATHFYIARNIYNLQQFMKINPFWPAASAPAPIFGAKHSNLSVMPSTELHGNIPGRPLNPLQDKGPGIAIFPTNKDNKSSQPATNIPDPAQRKQQVLLHQALPPVTPNNLLHGPAFIFPFNQQQAVAAAAASVLPGSSKPVTSMTGGVGAASGAANSAPASTSTTAAAPAMSFNYPSMTANETQYLAILQNNPYPFPIPAVGAPPNYRGSPHPQAMPLFNGSFYSSQMIHPSQLQQQQQQQASPTPPQHHQQPPQSHQNSSGSTSSSQKHLQIQQRQQHGGGGAAAINGSGGGNVHNNFPTHKSRSSQPPSQHMNQPPQARHLENDMAGGEDSPSTADSRAASRGGTTMSVYGHNFAMPVHSQNFALMSPQVTATNSSDKKQQQPSQQQGLKRGGAESSLPPQTFAMSFAPMNGASGPMSSVAQNHAIFQSLPESLRQSYHHMMAAPAVSASAQYAQQKKDFRISEETPRSGCHDSASNVDEDRKGSSTGLTGKSIAFSRPDLTTNASGSSTPIPGSSVIDSSSRNINLASNSRSSRSPMGATQSSQLAQMRHHQEQLIQIQKQQQQQQQQQSILNARSKNPPSSNGGAYPDQLITSSSSVAAKFPNSISSFQQNLVQTGNTTSTSQTQSPQWRNSVRGPTTSQVPSSHSSAPTSSLKNLHQSQQQSSRPHLQPHTQISFGASSNQRQPSTTPPSQQNPTSNSNNNQCPSPPMVVGSPTTSSMSKGGGGGAGGSPRTSTSASASGKTAQQPKNTSVANQRASPSILGNPHISNSNSNKSQQQHPQLTKQTLQQQQQQQQAQAQHMFFTTHPYMQVQAQASGSTTASGTSGYYLPRKQPQSSQQQNQLPTSTGMLSLCPPVTLASATTSDPAKAIAAAAAAANSNIKGGGGGGLAAAQFAAVAAAQSSNASAHQLLPAGFPQYVHTVPAAVQVKPVEQKQPAGNDNLRTCWQPEKK